MKKDNSFSIINLTRLFWILFVGLICIILINSLKRDFNHDEFEKVHTAWKILQGERIYIDFFQHSHPFFFYLLAPLIAILGLNSTALIVLRMVMFLMLLLILLVTCHLAAKVFNKKTAFISVLLLSSAQIFINRTIEIRPDVPQTLFGLLSLFLLFTYFENKSVKCLILSSISLGISFLFLQKTIFLITLIWCLLLINVYKKRVSYRDFLAYPSIFLLTLAPYYMYIVCSGSLSSYFTLNWVLITKFASRFTPFNAIGFALRTSTLLCVFYAWGLLKFCKTPNQVRTGWFSLGLLASTFLIAAPYKQSFMIAMPLIAIIAANAICLLFEREQKWILVVLLFAVVIPGFLLLKRAEDNNDAQLKEIDYVLSITDENDFVYDGNTTFNVFRKDIDFFWFSLRPKVGGLAAYKTIAEYEYDVYESIDKFRPKVISDYQIDNMQDERIAKHYAKSDKYKGLFIRTDYE